MDAQIENSVSQRTGRDRDERCDWIGKDALRGTPMHRMVPLHTCAYELEPPTREKEEGHVWWCIERTRLTINTTTLGRATTAPSSPAETTANVNIDIDR